MRIGDLSHTVYRRTMRDARKRLMAGSKILNTDTGDIEYAVREREPRFCSCMAPEGVTTRAFGLAK